MATAPSPLRIDVYADIVCPWCYLGERRLSRALEQRPDLEVERRWRPFQLRPDLPPEGRPWRAFAEEKFGSWDRARAAFDYVQQNADDDAVTFEFDRIASAPNTADAHRLVLWAARSGRTWEMVQALFHGYFAEGADVGDRETLSAAAAAVGLDPDAARSFLASDQERGIVQNEQLQAQQRGVRGVPFFVLNDRYTFSGAQPPEVFLRAFDAVERERAEVPAE